MNTARPRYELNDDHPYSDAQTILFTGLKSNAEGNIYVENPIPSEEQDHTHEKNMMEKEYEDMELNKETTNF